MELVPLRARARCALCQSKLPPRTEVYWDDAAHAATCQSCMSQIQYEDALSTTEPVMVELDERVDIDAPPAWGDTPDASADVDAAPDLGPRTGGGEGAEAPAPEPESAPLPPVAWSPFESPSEVISPGLTIRSEPEAAFTNDESSVDFTELDRGDMGEGRVGQTIEAARIHGLEVLHGFDLASGVRPIDHLVIAVNGIWVIRSRDTLTGRLERRDLGDWFSADPRLFVDDEDSTYLVDETGRQVEALRARLGPTPFGDVMIRGVVCYGTAPAGWVSDPFDIAGVRVTWRNLLVEPMLDPVMIDETSLRRLTVILAADRRKAKTA